MSFIQIIEYRTSRADEVDALLDEWRSTNGGTSSATRITQTLDRDTPATFLQIVEFPSYEAAMENSNRPETGEFAARMGALCEGQPTFRNLDVTRSEQM